MIITHSNASYGHMTITVLNAAKIEIYKGHAASVKDNVEGLNKGELEKIHTNVPVHFGMGAK